MSDKYKGPIVNVGTPGIVGNSKNISGCKHKICVSCTSDGIKRRKCLDCGAIV